MVLAKARILKLSSPLARGALSSHLSTRTVPSRHGQNSEPCVSEYLESISEQDAKRSGEGKRCRVSLVKQSTLFFSF